MGILLATLLLAVPTLLWWLGTNLSVQLNRHALPASSAPRAVIRSSYGA